MNREFDSLACATLFLQVQLWMALVASASFFVIPLLFMCIPFAVFSLISSRRVDMVVSLGNCLSAGLISSLGIMHIIPATVEAMNKVSSLALPSAPSHLSSLRILADIATLGIAG